MLIQLCSHPSCSVHVRKQRLPAASHKAVQLQCERTVGLIKTHRDLLWKLNWATKPTNHSLAVYSVGERTCTVGQREGRPPCCVLTREINCREEEEEKMYWRRRDGDEERGDGQVTPSREGREESVKRKTLEKNSMVRENWTKRKRGRWRSGNKKLDK